MALRLTGQQREILREAILRSYPNRDELEILLVEKMDIWFDKIARGDTYETGVFNLITDFEADGRIEEFIKALLKDRPNSPYLREIIEEFDTVLEGSNISKKAIQLLKEKLSYWERELAISSDPSQMFKLEMAIQQIQKTIIRLAGENFEAEPPTSINRRELMRTINLLVPQQFNELVFTINPPSGVIPSTSAPQSDRVYALLTWAESPSGIGLERLWQILGEILTSQPLAELTSSDKFDFRLMEQSQRFLEQASAEIRPQKKWLQVTSISQPKLSNYAPFFVAFIDQLEKQDIEDIYQQTKGINSNQNFKIALIFYNEQPVNVKMQIAQVRLEGNFIIIPISFIEIQKALISENSAASSLGLLASYAERYLPGADIFNDKNAIGDTVTFYGRTQLLQRLQEELIRYQGIGLLGIRKSGKTSILRQLQFSLREYPVVDIDLQPYGGKNLYGSEIFNQILTRLFSLLRMQDDSLRADFILDGSLPAKDSALKFSEKIAALAAKLNLAKFKSPIICFFDELERIFPAPDASQEKIEEFNAFFGALRQLSQQDKSLAFLIADVHPDFNRTNHWYETNLPTNPVYQFFKEVYIEPFSEDETVTMLAELGVFMGIKFETELLQKIHQMSGGHPFISRQITSILKKKIGDCNYLELSLSQKILDVILRDSNDLRSYFKNNIWGDLEKREFTCAIKAMIILACNDLVKGVSEEKLMEKLSNEFSENDCDESLSVLRDSGLIENKDSTHRIIIHLMANWIKRDLTKKEILQWQICSETIN